MTSSGMYSLRQVPCLRVRHHLVVGEFAHLLADRIERLVEAAGADRRAVLLRASVRRGGRGAAPCCRWRSECSTAGVHRAPPPPPAEPEIGEPHDLALAHRNAAEDLRQIFAGADAHQKLFDLAETARSPSCRSRIGGELAQRLDIGREPGEAVRGALLAVERARQPRGRPASTRSATARRASANKASTAATAWRSVAINSVAGGLGGCGKRHEMAPMSLGF